MQVPKSRDLMHQSMPGLRRSVWQDDKLFKTNRIAMPNCRTLSSAASIKRVGSDGIAIPSNRKRFVFQIRTIDRVTAGHRSPLTLIRLAPLLTDQWKAELAQRTHLWVKTQVGGKRNGKWRLFLVKTPYVLLLSVTWHNVCLCWEASRREGACCDPDKV